MMNELSLKVFTVILSRTKSFRVQPLQFFRISVICRGLARYAHLQLFRARLN